MHTSDQFDDVLDGCKTLARTLVQTIPMHMPGSCLKQRGPGPHDDAPTG